VEGVGDNFTESRQQNITISLGRQVLRKAKILAARRESLVSGLLAPPDSSRGRRARSYGRVPPRLLSLGALDGVASETVETAKDNLIGRLQQTILTFLLSCSYEFGKATDRDRSR
jgi:hypothetical protein